MGLIKRSGKLIVTAFGRIVFESQKLLKMQIKINVSSRYLALSTCLMSYPEKNAEDSWIT